MHMHIVFFKLHWDQEAFSFYAAFYNFLFHLAVCRGIKQPFLLPLQQLLFINYMHLSWQLYNQGFTGCSYIAIFISVNFYFSIFFWYGNQCQWIWNKGNIKINWYKILTATYTVTDAKRQLVANLIGWKTAYHCQQASNWKTPTGGNFVGQDKIRTLFLYHTQKKIKALKKDKYLYVRYIKSHLEYS